MKKFLRISIILITAGFMIWLFFNQWLQLRQLEWHCEYKYLLLSVPLLIIAYFMDAYGWHLILKGMNQRITALESVRIWMLSSFIRYVPGGIWPYTTRVTLSKKADINLSTSSLSLYLETIFLIASSFAVGFPALWDRTIVPIDIRYLPLIFIVFIFMVHPKFIGLMRFFPGKIGKLFSIVRLPEMKFLSCIYIYYLFFWFLLGLAFICFIYAFFPLPLNNWVQAGSILAFSFCIGFVVIFMPGGIGIRETTIYFFLVQFIPTDQAMLIAIGSRLWIMTGELLSFLALLVIPQRFPN